MNAAPVRSPARTKKNPASSPLFVNLSTKRQAHQPVNSETKTPVIQAADLSLLSWFTVSDTDLLLAAAHTPSAAATARKPAPA
jgi:hypothetical protein